MFANTTSQKIALAGGIAVVAAAAHLAIVYSGGYAQPGMWMVLAAAFAVIAGSIALANASGRWFAALLAGLVIGEAYAIVTTMDRVVTQRAALQAPAKAAATARTEAAERLAKAVDAARKADAAAVARSAEKDCKQICERFLTTSKAEAKAEIEAARKALDGLPAAPPVSPLAETIGVSTTAIELTLAILGSLAANGFGGILIAFGAHGTGRNTLTTLPAIGDDDLAATREFFAETPNPTPPRGPRKRKPQQRQDSNVVAFRSPVVKALEAAGGTVDSNQELARLMGCTEGEATKRVRESRHLVDVRREGKRLVISLKAQRAA